MIIIDTDTREHNTFVFRKVFENCMDRDTLKGRLINTFIYIMDSKEHDDDKKMELIALMYEVAQEFDPAVMVEGLDNYLIARQ